MPRKQRPAKWHHYVPQGYLRNFTTPGGRLYGYNKHSGEPFENAAPRDVAAEPDFHTDPRRGDPQELEHRLDREFERPLLGTINRVIARVRLVRAGLSPSGALATSSECGELAKFAALQMVRTRKTRGDMERMVSGSRTNGMTLTDRELTHYAHLGLLDEHMRDDFSFFGAHIAQHRLMFMVAPKEHSFWVSDHPVLVGRGSDDGRAFWGGVGLKDERLELYLPLAWDIKAVFYGRHIAAVPDIITIRPDLVASHNRTTFQAADRLVLGRSPITALPTVPAD